MNLKAKTEGRPPTPRGDQRRQGKNNEPCPVPCRTMETTAAKGEWYGDRRRCGDRRGCRGRRRRGCRAEAAQESVGTVRSVSMASWSTASRSTPEGTRERAAPELRPRSCLDKPQPVFPWRPTPAMIPSSLIPGADSCKMNTGSSSENIQLFTQSWSVDRVTTITQVWQEPGQQGGGKLPGGKGRLGVHGLEAGGQWLPPSAPLGPWRMIVGFPGGLGLGWRVLCPALPGSLLIYLLPENFSFQANHSATCPYPPWTLGLGLQRKGVGGSSLSLPPPPRALSPPPSPEQMFLHRVLCKSVCPLVRSVHHLSHHPLGPWSVGGLHRDLRAPGNPGLWASLVTGTLSISIWRAFA